MGRKSYTFVVRSRNMCDLADSEWRNERDRIRRAKVQEHDAKTQRRNDDDEFFLNVKVLYRLFNIPAALLYDSSNNQTMVDGHTRTTSGCPKTDQ